jgi:hypothetical protein
MARLVPEARNPSVMGMSVLNSLPGLDGHPKREHQGDGQE